MQGLLVGAVPTQNLYLGCYNECTKSCVTQCTLTSRLFNSKAPEGSVRCAEEMWGPEGEADKRRVCEILALQVGATS
jgi:hypothetical protein